MRACDGNRVSVGCDDCSMSCASVRGHADVCSVVAGIVDSAQVVDLLESSPSIRFGSHVGHQLCVRDDSFKMTSQSK